MDSKKENDKPAESTPSANTPDVSSSVAQQSSSPSADTAQAQTPPPPPPSVVHPTSKKSVPLAVIIFFLILSFLGGLLLAGLYFQSQLQKFTKSGSAQTAEVKTTTPDSKVLVIGTDATAPPMEYVNEKGGLVGYDIDLGYRVANELGMKAEFKNINWDNIFSDLENKKVDMVISSVTINDERKLKYNFSEPYINAGQVIVSRKDSPITSTAGLKGKKISVQKGTTCEKEAFKYTAANLVISYDQFIDAATAVSTGTADATICDLALMKGFVNKYDNLKITSDPFTNEYYGIVVRKDNAELSKKVNDALAVLRVKGILTDLKQKWLE